MTNIVSALTARTQLGQIMRRASQKNERFIVDRRGQPSVIIMSIKDYIDSISPAPAELRAMQERARQTGTAKLSMRRIDNLIAEVRQQQSGSRNMKRRAK